MAIIGDALRAGLGLASNLIPNGTGYNFSRAISNLGDQYNIRDRGISELFGNFQPVRTAYASDSFPTDGGTNTNTDTNTNTTNTGSTGSVLGTSNTDTNTTNTNTGTSDPYADIRNSISGGWDSYLGGLGGMLTGLEGQRSAQEGIAGNQYDQGYNTLTNQRDIGVNDLNSDRTETQQNQAKTLRDLSSNIRNSFMAGNIYLGSRGAGDSSAANQYSYALTKLGNRQRSDVMGQTSNIMNDINDREFQLKNTYDTSIKNLQSERDAKINQIAEWFNGAQNQIKQAIAEGGLNKSQDLANLSKDILTRSLTAIDRINEDVRNRQSALESWAMSNSDTIQQLRSNMGQIANFTPQLPGYQPVTGTPQVDSTGNLRVPAGFGSGADEKKDLFGNIIG